MIHQLLEKLDAKFHFEEAQAHCDIPCGIYDPSTAQIAALTVVRMMDLMADLVSGDEKGNVVPMNVKTGDRVLFPKYAGNEIQIEEVEHLFMREDDILGVIE